jgi:hypothetical protein
MKARIVYTSMVLFIGLVLGGILQPFQHVTSLAQGNCRTFAETGKQVCGRFLEYWTQNGGLAQQGLPLSNEFSEVSDLNGQTYTVQYFERAVFEKHPENARPHDVLLSQLGTFQFKRKYPNGDPSGGQPPPPTGEQPKTFSGTTSLNTPPFRLQGGTYEATWKAQVQRSSCFIGLRLNPTNGSFGDSILSATYQDTAPKSGSTFLYNVDPGEYFIEATTTGCSWEVTLTRR